MGTDVADITENKTDEHEEETDQREGCGRADHLWKRNPPVISNRSRIKYSFRCRQQLPTHITRPLTAAHLSSCHIMFALFCPLHCQAQRLLCWEIVKMAQRHHFYQAILLKLTKLNSFRQRLWLKEMHSNMLQHLRRRWRNGGSKLGHICAHFSFRGSQSFNLVQILMRCERSLTQHTNSGLRGHLEVSWRHVLDVEASALLLR